MSYKSYCFTVRPTKGLNEATEGRLVKWLAKQDYGYATIEMEGEARHMHGQIWLDNERARGEVNKSIKRICEDTVEEWNSAQAKVLSNGTKIAYDDFYTNYLIDAEKKADCPVNVVYEKVPDITSDYYPSEEEQEKVRNRVNAVDSRYHRLNEMYMEWDRYEQAVDKGNVAEFLCWAMFTGKVIPVIQDRRVSRQLCNALHMYNWGSGRLDHFLNDEDIEIAMNMRND